MSSPGWAADLIDEWIASAPSGSLLKAVDRWGNIGQRLIGHAVGEIVLKLAAHPESMPSVPTACGDMRSQTFVVSAMWLEPRDSLAIVT